MITSLYVIIKAIQEVKGVIGSLKLTSRTFTSWLTLLFIV